MSRIDMKKLPGTESQFLACGSFLAMARLSSDLKPNADSSWNYEVIVTFFVIKNFRFSAITQPF